MTDAGPRLVVLRALGLGDFCTAVPALRALRRAFPDHQMELAAPSWVAPLAERLGVDRVIDARDLTRPLPVRSFVAIAVNLHGKGPWSTAMLRALSPESMLSFRPTEADGEDGPIWRDGEHDRVRWCRLLRHWSIEADPDDVTLTPPRATSLPTGPRVVVHPGAGAPARRWPPERFAAVVRVMTRGGLDVALVGDGEERRLAEYVARLGGRRGGRGRIRVLAGRTTIDQLASLVATATAVVANDSGVAHLASAFGIPSVVLFGPTPPSEWGPPARGPHRALWAGRRGDPHGDRVDAGLLAIDVGDVLDALASVGVSTRAPPDQLDVTRSRTGSELATELGQRGPQQA